MDLKKLFGNRIKELRSKKRMTQFELAEAVGIDSKHLSHIETGRSFPKALLIEKLADKLDINIDSFFEFQVLMEREKLMELIIKDLYQLSDKDLSKIYKILNILFK